MKVKVYKTTSSTVDIEAPLYCKNISSLFKIVDENTSIRIALPNSITGASIEIVPTQVAQVYMDVVCTEKEFYEAFDNAVKFLRSK